MIAHAAAHQQKHQLTSCFWQHTLRVPCQGWLRHHAAPAICDLPELFNSEVPCHGEVPHCAVHAMQVQPLCQELWQLTDEQVQVLQAGLLLALGALQVAAARACAQAHLHGAMVQVPHTLTSSAFEMHGLLSKPRVLHAVIASRFLQLAACACNVWIIEPGRQSRILGGEA